MSSENKKRTRMVRAYPTHTLEEVIPIASAIQEHNAGLPFDRKLLARELGTTPASSGYTMRLNSSAKYGLTHGGYSDEQIRILPRGQAVVTPKESSERRKALVDAAMQPDVFGKFYKLLDGRQLPEEAYAQNLIQREFGIHQDLTEECLNIIRANGLYVGIIEDEDNGLIVNIPAQTESVSNQPPGTNETTSRTQASVLDASSNSAKQGKVFIGHNGDLEMAGFLASILEGFDIPFVLVNNTGPTNGLVSPQISSEMKECTSAILVITNSDVETNQSQNANSIGSTIYQLGAASVLYDSRILILKKHGVELGFNAEGVSCMDVPSSSVLPDAIGILQALHAARVITVSA